MASLDVNARYELERELGRGGMGTVYRARDRETGELVAVKVLRRRLVRDLIRFNREVGVLSGLEHPNIVRYLGHGELANGKPVLIMEWVEGETLSRRMHERGLTMAESVATVTRIADALAFAHARGIIHRDLKPDNVLFTADGTIKVIDFGVARRISDAIGLTRTGMRIGTPSYMSPEQARGQRAVDARADVFVLGCVLYECVTGHRAFAAANLQALLATIILSDPAPAASLCPRLPPPLADLIDRMLAKDPADRPIDAGAVLRELEALPAMPATAPRPLIATEQGTPAGGTAATVELPMRSRPKHPTFIMLMVPPDEDDLDPEDDTLEDTARETMARALREEAERRGLKVEVLANGSVLGVLSGAEEPRQLAARLAECALSVKRWAPEVSVAFLSDFRGTVQDTLGHTLERGFAQLETAALKAMNLAQGGEAGVVHVDETTAKLLEGQFAVVQDRDGTFQLVGTEDG